MKSTEQAAYALAGKLLPGKVLEGLKALGFKKKQIISAFAAYHLETNFFDHAENYLSKENKFKLRRDKVPGLFTHGAARVSAENILCQGSCEIR